MHLKTFLRLNRKFEKCNKDFANAQQNTFKTFTSIANYLTRLQQ